jgi:uncharacterized protein YgiM (DUF1202 family)
MTIPLDSSDLNNQKEMQNSQPQSEPSITLSYKEQKQKLLSQYQDEATEILTMMRQHKDYNYITVINSCLLIIGALTDGPIRNAVKMMLSDNLQAELEINGILPEPTKQEDSGPVSETP